MPEWLNALLLGLIQGLTEFLPVSSSGHLEIARYLFGNDALSSENLHMTIVLHVATALATVVVFRKEILEIIKDFFGGKRDALLYVGYIIVSLIPAGVVGLLFEDKIASFFTQNLRLVGSMLLVTGLLLLFAHYAKAGKSKLNFLTAFIIGCAQALAIMPGLSRSGSTISASLILGISKEKAAQFSFLMVIPLILGKMILDIAGNEYTNTDVDWMPLLIGFASAFFAGLFACRWMIHLVKKSGLMVFAIYCLIMAVVLWVI